MKERIHMLLIKLLGIKGFIWIVGSFFLWYGKIGSNDWMILSLGIGGLNVAQKVWVNERPNPGT